MRKTILIPFIALLITACGKEDADYFVPYYNHPLNDTTWAMTEVPSSASVNNILPLLTQPAAYDSFSAATGAGVHLADLDINVPQNTCVFANDSAVTGIVRLAIRQLRKKGDFIRYGKATSSYGSLLESAGAFIIDATNDGSEVFIRSGKKVGLVFKEPNPAQNMKVFYGKDNLQPPLPEGTNSFTWELSNDSSHVSTFSTGSITGYNMMTGRFDMNNCARYIDTALPKTYVTAILPANFTNMNTMVYAVFKQQNTVVQLNADPATKTFYAPNFPLTSDVVIVSMSMIGNTLYLGTKEIVVTTNSIVSVNPAITGAQEVSDYLDSL